MKWPLAAMATLLHCFVGNASNFTPMLLSNIQDTENSLAETR
jgi:hypothetical protein